MKLIIAGSRGIDDHTAVALGVVSSPWSPIQILEVVSGGARGVDALGEEWAKGRGIGIRRFPADWALGPKAGPVRNTKMAAYADALLAIWDGRSRGTLDIITKMVRAGKPVWVHMVR